MLKNLEKLRGYNIRYIDKIIENAIFRKNVSEYSIYYSDFETDTWRENYTIIFKNNEPFAILECTFIIIEYCGIILGYEDCIENGEPGEVIDIKNGIEILRGYNIDGYKRLDNKEEKW